ALAGHGDAALDGVALYLAAEAMREGRIADLRHHREADLGSVHPELRELSIAVPDAHLTAHHLELLIEVERVRNGPIPDLELGFPLSRHVRGHYPQENVALARIAHLLLRNAQGLLLVRLPLAHRIVVRHDPRPRLEGEYLRAQLRIHLRQEVSRDHGGFGEVGLEQVLLDEARLVLDALFLCAVVRQLEE